MKKKLAVLTLAALAAMTVSAFAASPIGENADPMGNTAIRLTVEKGPSPLFTLAGTSNLSGAFGTGLGMEGGNYSNT